MTRSAICCAAIVAFLVPCWNAGAFAQPKSNAAALKELAQAEKGSDSGAFLVALKAVLDGDDARSVKAAVGAYARFARVVMQKMGSREFMTFHGKAADVFTPVKSKEAIVEFQKLLAASGPEWEGRLLLLDAAGFVKSINRLESCLTAIRDEHPAVVRRALQYLVNAKQVPVVEAIVKRYVEISKKTGKSGEAAQWERTRLAFQSALQRLLGVDLPAPEDYKNYFETRKSDPKLFEPKREDNGVSRVTLFGAAVTGKNIIFVLDISGSMMTTDPRPDDEIAKRREQGRTVVSGAPAEAEKKREPPLERQRMYRAKKELSNVVQSLPSDVRFNLITYSSDVRSWKKTMVPASDENKKNAVAHIEGLKPDGVTVTDVALEEAFSDLNVDTIYLVTDGAPTHVGSSGPGMPEDAAQIISAIHERTAELNFLRGVRIFTLGFKEANTEFLEKLAADNSGTYVGIR